MNLINKTFVTITDKIKGDSLKARCVRGMMILGAGTFIERGFKVLRYVILARVLAPDEFGLMAIVIAASTFFEAFTEVGVRQSIIQNKKGTETEYLNMAWWFQALRGLGLFALAVLAAPWISSFYQESDLLPLLRVAFLTLLFNGLVSPRAHVLEKEFQFGKVVLLVQGSGLLGALLTIALAFFVRNVWALVIGFIVEAMLRCLLSFIVCPFRPRLSIDKDSLFEILKFARGMFGLPILAFLAYRTDVIVLGRVVDKAQLGMYSLALILAQMPRDFFARVVGPVLLPAFSKKQDDKASLCGAVLELTRNTATFAIPLVAFLVVCSDTALSVVFGSQYASVAVPFSLMCICSLLIIQAVPLVGIYLGMGQPHLNRRFAALCVIILATLIYPGISLFGLPGAAGVVLLANFIALGMQVFWMRKLIDIAYREYLFCWLPGLCLAGVVLIPISLLNATLLSSPLLSLVVGGLLCLGAWGVGLLFLLNLKKYTKRCVQVNPG